MAAVDQQCGPNVLADILVWCGDLPGWQQDALRRIVEGCGVEDSDITELTLLCKHENGLTEDGPLPELKPLRAEHVPQGTRASVTVTLRRISHVENVNALCGKQELTFAEKGLTVVFGYNASGKSGYGRILRRACRSRSAGPAIMPNLLGNGINGPASAEIIYALDGQEYPPEQWIDGQRSIDPLGSVSYFDSECAVVHVQEPNSIAFTPFGLDILPRLGSACKDVQKRLDQDRKRLEMIRPKFLQSSIATGATSVGTLLKSLRATSDAEAIERLASLSDAEGERLKSLPSQLANDPKKQAQELRIRSRRIAGLCGTLSAASKSLSDVSTATLKKLASECKVKAKAAEMAASVVFSDDPLQGIGDEVWRELWEAARQYSSVAFPERTFPVVDEEDSRCVLCQQPLADDAKERLKRFEQFVRDDTATQAAKAKAVLDNASRALDGLGLRDATSHDQLADLKLADPGIATNARRMMATLLLRYRGHKRAIASGNWEFMVPATSDASDELNGLVQRLNVAADNVEKTANQEERNRLESDLAELKAREWLGTVLGDVKEHLLRLVEIEKLTLCIEETRTTKITAKSKSLAKEHVTDHLRDAFASEIRRMHQGVRRLNVELTAAAGEFGSSNYQVQLIGASKAAIEAIVSEGEHRCIALAGFLSELATEASGSAIVFDDPVNSLDHNWRECFSRRLVEEGARRQVIVFTHDVVFLHDLLDGCHNQNIPIELRRLQTNREHCGIVSDDLPWVAQKTLQRIDELEKQGRAARVRYDNHNDDEYEREIAGLYSDLRATLERAIEEWVFRRVILRHRDYINLDGLKYVTLLTMNDCQRLQTLFKKCCDLTDAHDRAALRSFGVPHPDDAMNDVGELRAIVDDLRSRQSAI